MYGTKCIDRCSKSEGDAAGPMNGKHTWVPHNEDPACCVCDARPMLLSGFPDDKGSPTDGSPSDASKVKCNDCNCVVHTECVNDTPHYPSGGVDEQFLLPIHNFPIIQTLLGI